MEVVRASEMLERLKSRIEAAKPEIDRLWENSQTARKKAKNLKAAADDAVRALTMVITDVKKLHGISHEEQSLADGIVTAMQIADADELLPLVEMLKDVANSAGLVLESCEFRIERLQHLRSSSKAAIEGIGDAARFVIDIRDGAASFASQQVLTREGLGPDGSPMTVME